MWEWQWGVGRSLLKTIGSPHEPTYLAPEAAGAVADRQDTVGNIVRDANGQAKVAASPSTWHSCRSLLGKAD
jgi:hypothetical protein